MIYLDLNTFFFIVLAIFFGGLVKGTLGVGLPMISVPIIAFFLPPTKAIMLLCFPILCSNFLQMKVHEGIGSYRFAPMLFTLIIGLIIGGRLILEIELSTVSIIIAISIIAAAVVNLFGLNFRNVDIKYERSFTMILGFFSGILGGLSTFFGPPILAYLISIELEKEYFIRIISTIYFIGGFTLYSSLLYHGIGSLDDLYLRLFLVLPTVIAQNIGTKIRRHLSNEIFRNSILIILIIIGISLLFKNI